MMIAATLLLLLARTAAAAFSISTTQAIQCKPLNITFDRTAAAYPYTIWISGVNAGVLVYQINADYPVDAPFQYSVPSPGGVTASFVVAVSDNAGNGNSTETLTIQAPTGSDSSCDPFTLGSSWLYASDSLVGVTDQVTVGGVNVDDMVSCGKVQFYPTTQTVTGTAPFTVTWLPLQQRPITLHVPQAALFNSTYFIYNATLPFPEGTSFQIIAGDVKGGPSGGASGIFVTNKNPDNDTSCLASSYTLPDLDTQRALPANGAKTAVFLNLPGAVANPSSGGSGGGSNVGAITGGVIGGAIALGVVIACAVALLVYKRRRQRRRLQAARKEGGPHFVDLDGDDDGHAVGPDGHHLGPAGSARTARSYAQQHYDGPASPHSPDELLDPNARQLGGAGSGAYEEHARYSLGGAPSTPRPAPLSHAGSFSGAGAGLAFDGSDGAGSAAGYNPSSSAGRSLARGTTTTSGSSRPASRPTSAGTGAGSATAGYQLRATNLGDEAPRQAGPLPAKNPGGPSAGVGPSGSRRRQPMQHADGGPAQVLQSHEDEDGEVDELPPLYGGWVDAPPATAPAPPPAPAPPAPAPAPPEATAASYYETHPSDLAGGSIALQDLAPQRDREKAAP